MYVYPYNHYILLQYQQTKVKSIHRDQTSKSAILDMAQGGSLESPVIDELMMRTASA